MRASTTTTSTTSTDDFPTSVTFKYRLQSSNGLLPGFQGQQRGCYDCVGASCCLVNTNKCKCNHSSQSYCGGSSNESDLQFKYGSVTFSSYKDCGSGDPDTCSSSQTGRYVSCMEPMSNLSEFGVMSMLCPSLGNYWPSSMRMQNLQGLSQSASQHAYNVGPDSNTAKDGVDLINDGVQVECTYSGYLSDDWSQYLGFQSVDDFTDEWFIETYRGYFVGAGTETNGADGAFPYSFQRSSSKSTFAGKLWYQNLEDYLDYMFRMWSPTEETPVFSVSQKGVDGNSVVPENSALYWSTVLPTYCPQLASSFDNCPFDTTGTFMPRSLYSEQVNATTGQFKKCSNFFRDAGGVDPDISDVDKSVYPGNWSYCSDVLIGRNYYDTKGSVSGADVTAATAAAIVKTTCQVNNIFTIPLTEKDYQSYVISGCNSARPASLPADVTWYPGAPSTGYNECACVATTYPEEIVQPYQYCVFNQSNANSATCGNLSSLCQTNANAGCWFSPCWDAGTNISNNKITSCGLLTSNGSSDTVQLPANCSCNICANISCNNSSDIQIDQFTQTVECGEGAGSGDSSGTSVCTLGYSSGGGSTVQTSQGYTFVYGTVGSVSAEAEDGSIYSANLVQVVVDLGSYTAKSSVLSARDPTVVVDYEAIGSSMSQALFVGPTVSTVVPFPTCAFTDDSCFDKTSPTAASWRMNGKSGYKVTTLIKVKTDNVFSALNAQYNPINCAYAYDSYDDAVKGSTGTIAKDTLPHGWAFIGVYYLLADGSYNFVTASSMGLSSAAASGVSLLAGSATYGVEADDIVVMEYTMGTVVEEPSVTPENESLSLGAIALIVAIAVILIVVIVVCAVLLPGQNKNVVTVPTESVSGGATQSLS
jgi:hypothetical protein